MMNVHQQLHTHHQSINVFFFAKCNNDLIFKNTLYSLCIFNFHQINNIVQHKLQNYINYCCYFKYIYMYKSKYDWNTIILIYYLRLNIYNRFFTWTQSFSERIKQVAMTCASDNTDFICITARFTLFKNSYINVMQRTLDCDSEQTRLHYTYLIPMVPP